MMVRICLPASDTVSIHLIRTSELSEFDISKIQKVRIKWEYELSESKTEIARISVYRENSLNSYVRIIWIFHREGKLFAQYWVLPLKIRCSTYFLQFIVY